MIGSEMQDMMDQNMMMKMIRDPETREKIFRMLEPVDGMKKLLSLGFTGDEFNAQMTHLIQSHMKEM